MRYLSNGYIHKGIIYQIMSKLVTDLLTDELWDLPEVLFASK